MVQIDGNGRIFRIPDFLSQFDRALRLRKRLGVLAGPLEVNRLFAEFGNVVLRLGDRRGWHGREEEEKPTHKPNRRRDRWQGTTLLNPSFWHPCVAASYAPARQIRQPRVLAEYTNLFRLPPSDAKPSRRDPIRGPWDGLFHTGLPALSAPD